MYSDVEIKFKIISIKYLKFCRKGARRKDKLKHAKYMFI